MSSKLAKWMELANARGELIKLMQHEEGQMTLRILELTQERDFLLETVRKCLNMVGHPDNIAIIETAIAKVENR